MTLLTTAEFRELHSTALEEAALQLLLDAAEQEIDRAAGPLGSTLEIVSGGHRYITLARRASAITSINETRWTTATTLAADDYILYPNGYVIERISGGTNSRWSWWGRIAVTYTPLDDEDIRKGVQADLVNLMVSYQPGLTMEQVGSWTTQMSSNSAWNNDMERDMIIGRLSPDPSLLVVGG